MRICVKSKCPKRVTYEIESYSDDISTVCLICGRLHYQSKLRTKRFYVVSLITFLFILISVIGIGINNYVRSTFNIISHSNIDIKPNTVELTLQTFFDALNSKNYNQAHMMTDHPIWGNFSNFKTIDYWTCNNDFKILELQKRYYTSKYGASDILNVKFRYLDSVNVEHIDLYDFHFLKTDSTEWRIIRMVTPKY